MAEKEKSTPKKRSTRQAMAEAVAETEKAVAQRKETESRPQERLAAKAVSEAVAVADELSSDAVVRAISELKSTVARTLTQLSDRLEEEIGKYSQVRRAVATKDAELQEIYEIQRSASTLLATLETNQRKEEELDREYQAEKERLDREIADTREQWEVEWKQHELEVKERDTAEQKRRQRDADEFKYGFAREQQLARDKWNDELAKAEKELSERKERLEREWEEREKALAARERELAELRARAAGFAQELKTTADEAARDAVARLQQQHQSEIELLRRESEGEKNVLSTKNVALERTVKEQAEQLARSAQQAEKAYTQVQEIAVRAIEGSASAKQLAHLQQLLADQIRKSNPPER
jgi:hypothetical protein